jgi:hypothetical protein
LRRHASIDGEASMTPEAVLRTWFEEVWNQLGFLPALAIE